MRGVVLSEHVVDPLSNKSRVDREDVEELQ
jgi:hypothetical protein